MKIYLKEEILEEIKNIIEYSSEDATCLKYAKLLLDKVNEEHDITLSKEEITKFLFDENKQKINNDIFNSLRSIGADLSGVSFDNITICNHYFNGLENVVINLDKVPNKDLSFTNFDGVTLIGTLDNAIIEWTNFSGYKGNLVLNPQTLKNKSFKGSNLSGITINGSLDNIDISIVDFTNTKGNININPQNIPEKRLYYINFSNTTLVGDYNEVTKTYDDPSFRGCIIDSCKFKNAAGNIVIDLNEIKSNGVSKLTICDLTGVIVKGNTKSNYEPMHCMEEDGKCLFNDVKDDLFGCYYTDNDGKHVHVHLFESAKWDDGNKKWEFISRKSEKNLQINVEFNKNEKAKTRLLSLFKK